MHSTAHVLQRRYISESLLLYGADTPIRNYREGPQQDTAALHACSCDKPPQATATTTVFNLAIENRRCRLGSMYLFESILAQRYSKIVAKKLSEKDLPVSRAFVGTHV